MTEELIDLKIECLRIAHDINESLPDVCCLESIAYDTGKLAEWVFSGPPEYMQSRIQCVDLALRTLAQQTAINIQLMDDNETPLIKVSNRFTFVLNAAKVYAKFVEQDSWQKEKDDD